MPKLTVSEYHRAEGAHNTLDLVGPEILKLRAQVAALQSQLNEAKAGWDSAIADLYAAAEIAKGMQSQLDAKWISVDVKLPPVMRAVLTTDGKRVTQTYRTSHDKRMWGAWAPDQVTFWQPLPPPPSGAKGETKP